MLPSRKVTWVMVLWRQMKSPILLLLVVAAVLSFITGDRADTSIILVILLASVGLGFGNEWRAEPPGQLAARPGLAHGRGRP